ncbi:uncharacterized protein LOC142357984 isoform X2 [Convolutriloba macropyga]|uniref:uncharacterized protein LOC142357984 isoform X2 n=1 Tax=Convolutriloba macropyga TaxID=536237 RepID=UPI003F525B23
MGASSTKSLEGKTALITGASRGLGQQLVLYMSRLGLSKVIILGVSEEATLNFINSMATSEHSLHTTAVFYKCDVSNLDHIQSVMQKVFTDTPIIDILINNAGYVIGKDALDTLFGEFEKILHVNLLSHIYLTKLILPRMLESHKGGQIVFVSSVLGLFTIPGASAYVTSKHALNGFVSSLQQELKQRKVTNVSVQLVCPGHFDSQMFQEAKVKYPRLTPPMKTEEVAKVIVEECILDRERRFLITPWLMGNSVLLAKLILPNRRPKNTSMTTEVSDAIKVESLEAELQELDNECEKLEKKLQKRDKSILDLKEQLDRATEENSRFKTQIETLQREQKNKNKVSPVFQTNQNTFEIKSLKDNLKRKDEDLKASEQKYKSLRAQNSQLEERIAALKQSSDVNINVVDLQAEIAKRDRKLEKFKKEIESVNEDLNLLDKREAEIETLKSEIEKLKIDKTNALAKETSSPEYNENDLLAEIDELTQQLHDAASSIESCEIRLKEQQVKLDEIPAKDREIEDMKKEVAELEQKLKVEAKKQAGSKKDGEVIKQLRSDLADYKKENSELYGEVDFLKDKVTKLQKSLVQKTVNDNAANTVADLSDELMKQQQQLQTVTEENDELRNSVVLLEEANKGLKNELQMRQRELDQLTVAEISAREEAEIQKEKASILASKNAEKEAKSESSLDNDSLLDLQNQLAHSKDDVLSLNSELNMLKDQLVQKNRQISDLNKESTSRIGLTKENIKLKVDVQQLSSKLASQESVNEKLEHKIKSLREYAKSTQPSYGSLALRKEKLLPNSSTSTGQDTSVDMRRMATKSGAETPTNTFDYNPKFDYPEISARDMFKSLSSVQGSAFPLTNWKTADLGGEMTAAELGLISSTVMSSPLSSNLSSPRNPLSERTELAISRGNQALDTMRLRLMTSPPTTSSATTKYHLGSPIVNPIYSYQQQLADFAKSTHSLLDSMTQLESKLRQKEVDIRTMGNQRSHDRYPKSHIP